MARYYRESAQTWEKQALLKARFVAGDRRIGEAYLRDIQDILFGLPLGEVAKAEIGMMKDRIERERLKPGERETNLKLGHGGLSDIEFIAQSKQWQAGLTAPETRAALRALASRGHLSGPDAILCERAYDRLATIRNRLALAGLDGDRLPDDSRSVRRLAFSMGVPDRQGTRAEDCLRDELGSLRKDVRRLLERELRPIRRGLRS
jgi:glutamate-ammonia-ligase adenylyltransferase